VASRWCRTWRWRYKRIAQTLTLSLALSLALALALALTLTLTLALTWPLTNPNKGTPDTPDGSGLPFDAAVGRFECIVADGGRGDAGGDKS
jgi:hypothetical protein